MSRTLSFSAISLCDQGRLRSACASTQSDQSFIHEAASKGTCTGLSESSLPHMFIVGNVTLRFNCCFFQEGSV